MQYHAIQCNTLQCHVLPCSTMQYNAIPCNTMPHLYLLTDCTTALWAVEGHFYQNDAFTSPLENVIFLEKVKNVRNVDGPGRSEQLIMWDGNRLMKFLCEAWWWWDETEEEETCGQTQLWAMNLRHLIFQLHWRSSLQQFSVLSCEGGWYSCIHIKYIIGMHNYIHIYKLGSNFSLSP